jgi:hypothetical protein
MPSWPVPAVVAGEAGAADAVVAPASAPVPRTTAALAATAAARLILGRPRP